VKTDEGTEVVVEKRDISLLVLTFIVLALAVSMNVVNLIILSSNSEKAAKTYAAVCTYRGELTQQVKASELYLQSHPNGAPVLGISAAQIQQSIDREKAAVESLSDLHC
jgi:hypothetical protein